MSAVKVGGGRLKKISGFSDDLHLLTTNYRFFKTIGGTSSIYRNT
ncbi:hypothetical protein HMPREF1051_1454 [Neisseria sicca VK64]|uniref:Uncharacterized protein n=1 Tax=Neisseria sicca VK64 TaxID=1095748 RepID=I2NUL6_NEISI|nr:hypothetical protein HMPREF1051_1454 [Neisseria sicca VK64]